MFSTNEGVVVPTFFFFFFVDDRDATDLEDEAAFRPARPVTGAVCGVTGTRTEAELLALLADDGSVCALLFISLASELGASFAGIEFPGLWSEPFSGMFFDSAEIF